MVNNYQARLLFLNDELQKCRLIMYLRHSPADSKRDLWIHG